MASLEAMAITEDLSIRAASAGSQKHGNKFMGVILVGLRFVLGILFLYSGLEKVLHPYDFLGNVYDFELTGAGLGMIVAMVLPWLEMLLALSLILNMFPGGALLGCVLLGLLFVGVQFSAIVRGLSVNCGCFGPDDTKMVGMMTFLRTCTITGAAILAWGGYLMKIRRQSKN